MIFNLTQHQATPDQLAAGVVEPNAKVKNAIRHVLTFHELPSTAEILERADVLAEIAVRENYNSVMIGGAPYLMAPLEQALRYCGITPLYAYSVRKSEDMPDGKGGVRKVTVFRHVGFVSATLA